MPWKTIQNIRLFPEMRFQQQGTGPKYKNSKVTLQETLKEGDVVQISVWAPGPRDDAPGISISKYIDDGTNPQRVEPGPARQPGMFDKTFDPSGSTPL